MKNPRADQDLSPEKRHPLPFVSRRTFVKATAAAAPFLAKARGWSATPLGLPIGLQLYTVGAEMDKDPIGTLKAIADIGYKQVELSPLAKIAPAELKKALDDKGLKNPSGHFMLTELIAGLKQKIDLAHLFGQQYMVVTVPGVSDPSRFKSDGKDQTAAFLGVLNSLTLDDWKWNAEQFNKIGEQIKRAGLQLCYHNHNFDFKPLDGTTGYDEFMRLTDRELVKFELDCGWAVVAGVDPVAYLTNHADRYCMLHIKDFKKGFFPSTKLGIHGPNTPVPTELGHGAIDYRPVFEAARKAHIAGYYVEQEPWVRDMPVLQAVQVDYEYLAHL
jgi:sugar phosphate isomerase/epimerase